jgi:tetratricopeptide (TPR) repeat protein
MNRKERRKNKIKSKPVDINNEFIPAYNAHKSGNLDEAEILYENLLRKYPKHFDTLRHLGILNQDRHLLNKALNFFLRAKNVNPNSHEIYNNLGSIMFQKYKHEEAKILCEKSLSLKPNYLPALNNLVMLYYRLHYAEDALKISNKTLEVYPNDLRAQTNHALALTINGELDKAISIFEEIARIKPNSDNLKNLGTSYRDAGKIEKSYECFVKALEYRPDDESIFFNISASKLNIPDKNILTSFEKALNSKKNLDYNQKTGIGFSLYNSYRKLKNYKKSGEFLVVGNNHADEWIKSDFKKEKKLIDALKVFFTKDLIKKNLLK